MIATLAATVFAAIASLFGIGERAQEHASARTVVWALGDGADGGADGRRLARFVRSRRPDRFFYLGDVYERGTRAEFRANYHPLYGRLARRTDPVLGNHEFKRRAKGYYPYWKRRRGFGRERARHRAYVDETGWQIDRLLVRVEPHGRGGRGCAGRSRRHPGTCRLAAAHRGRYVVADDVHGDSPEQQPLWDALAGRTAINLVGHNHLYGRLAPIDGVHVLVAGAGGHSLRPPIEQPHAVAALEAGVPTRDAARAAPRAGGLQAVRRERARLRLRHDHLHARPLSRVSRSTSPAPSRRPRCSCWARRTRAPRRRPARPRGSASSGRGRGRRPTARAPARRRRASAGRCR